MARYFDVNPDNPQPRALDQIVAILRAGGVIAYPTDSGFALGSLVGNRSGADRIRAIRDLDERHHMTVVVSEFGQLGRYVQMDNRVFRAIKAATPGPYTFILEATREVPRVMQHPRKRTIGVRVPDHVTTLALLDRLGEPLMWSSSEVTAVRPRLSKRQGKSMRMVASHSGDARLDGANDRQSLGQLLSALADALARAGQLNHGRLAVDEDAACRGPANSGARLILRPHREWAAHDGEDIGGRDRGGPVDEYPDVAGHGRRRGNVLALDGGAEVKQESWHVAAPFPGDLSPHLTMSAPMFTVTTPPVMVIIAPLPSEM